jgi:hypothetical protein
VTAPGSRGAIVIDTDVFSADLVPRSRLAERYAPIITGRPAFISFQTATELRYWVCKTRNEMPNPRAMIVA